ncbi:MAG: hypothetical protein QF441_10295 [Bacteriovoracaceae bacterium]|nr:hypothetical protein [Bacteriovoracaceae bacterium]
MKTLGILIFVLASLDMYAAPHLPLDLSFSEYQKIYQNLPREKSKDKQTEVDFAIEAGQKMSDWIKLINSNRSADQAIRLTSKESQSNGIPIESPKKYGPKTIKADYQDLVAHMPKELAKVILFGEELTTQPPLKDDDFIFWCRKVSLLYQTAVRWTTMKGWLGYYAQRKKEDVRGFYTLKKRKNLDAQLKNYENLEEKDKFILKESLIGICLNSSVAKYKCELTFFEAVQLNKLVEYKNRYWSRAQTNWEGFFKISNPRDDVSWVESSPGVMQVVFKDPKDEEIASWLKQNVEDEFNWREKNWSMELNFISGNYQTAYIEFKKNVTPHVKGGNKIVMDANTQLEEYGVKWTIRHEFGHILRLPDCYHEFYDEEEKVMVNYQIDVSDLMCSRAGQMNERIFKELKRVYLKK